MKLLKLQARYFNAQLLCEFVADWQREIMLRFSGWNRQENVTFTTELQRNVELERLAAWLSSPETGIFEFEESAPNKPDSSADIKE